MGVHMTERDLFNVMALYYAFGKLDGTTTEIDATAFAEDFANHRTSDDTLKHSVQDFWNLYNL